MPRQAADLEEALNKKGGLTLSQLANYDDLITDALVDRVYYWSEIRKLKANYHACRAVQEEEVCKILQQHVVVEKDPIIAHKKMLALPGIAKYSKGLKTEDEKEHFERHLRKYINIYLPDCPFEVDTTNRYTIMTAEACIKARKPIRKGEAIKYLSGIQVEMSEKEEKDLSNRTDFSIVLSSRRKRPSLFLGPARFANHDCDSNARLNTTGPHGIHIVACKDIAPGEEITVTYGEDYFGIDNCECLCATCENLLRNGWDPRGPVLHENNSDEEDDEEEVPVKVVEPKPAPQPETQSHSPSNLGKRKRGYDTPPANLDSNANPPKKRGRPRKYPRPEDNESTAITVASKANTHQLQPQVVTREHGLLKSGFADDSDDDGISSRDGQERLLPHREETLRAEFELKKTNRFNGRYTQSSERESERSKSSAGKDDLLDKIFNLLSSIGDRKLKEMSSRTATPKAADIETEAGAEEYSDKKSGTSNTVSSDFSPQPRGDTESPGSWTLSPSFSPRPSPAYARGMARSPSMESSSSPQRMGKADGAQLEVPKASLSALKKERSVSSLRNVINAEDDERDVFMMRSANSGASGRRDGAWQGPTEELSPDDAENSSDSSSPSASNNDSSSSTSQTSSLTSLGSFAAGNIADSICRMLTTEEGEQHVDGVQDTPDMMEMGLGARDTENAPVRGRRVLRKSPRRAAPEISTPPVQSIERIEIEDSDDDDDDEEKEEERGPARTPGDYTLCKALLSTTYHRWIECRNCDEHFVQGDAYLTRIACPRCERHSKLYGYYWPKTDKEGKFDPEERVLDHRTIHRFIEPDEERNERKGRKTLADVLKEQELSSRQQSEESERAGVGKRLRNSPRRDEGRRKMRMTT